MYQIVFLRLWQILSADAQFNSTTIEQTVFLLLWLRRANKIQSVMVIPASCILGATPPQPAIRRETMNRDVLAAKENYGHSCTGFFQLTIASGLSLGQLVVKQSIQCKFSCLPSAASCEDLLPCWRLWLGERHKSRSTHFERRSTVWFRHLWLTAVVHCCLCGGGLKKPTVASNLSDSKSQTFKSTVSQTLWGFPSHSKSIRCLP